jgi:hypothetical protein
MKSFYDDDDAEINTRFGVEIYKVDEEEVPTFPPVFELPAGETKPVVPKISTNTASSDQPEDTYGNTPAIVVGTVGALVLVCLIAFVAISRRERRSGSKSINSSSSFYSQSRSVAEFANPLYEGNMINQYAVDDTLQDRQLEEGSAWNTHNYV